MATKNPMALDETPPKYRFTYRADQNKFGRMIALLLGQHTSKDTRGDAQVRFDVYPAVNEQVHLSGPKYRNQPVFISRIYVQRDLDKDDKLPGRPYLLVEERALAHGEMNEGLNVESITVTMVDQDEKGRPRRFDPREVTFAQLPWLAADSYEFLVGM
jgi:hypothetical protein